MTPFTFANDQVARADWTRFVTAADAWKPSGYDIEMSRRLAYYLDDQEEELRAELKRRFPETSDKMTPVTVPLARLLTQEQAKVFLSSTKLDLAQDGKDEVDEDLASWWSRVKEQLGLSLRLKKVDAYTTLLRTAALRIGFVDGEYTAHVVFPQGLKMAADPSAPLDPDRAYGVAVEIASEGGVRAGGARRWEFWCAREGDGETPLHCILEVAGVGGEGEQTVRVVERDDGDPLRRPDGKAIVPLALFTAHTEELGLFATEGKGLVPANLGLNVLVTDIHHIAEQQGFGVLVLTAPAGENAPARIVRAPNTAISLTGGVTAQFINPNAPLADLVALADTRIKQAAVFRGLPAGAVSIEARAVASGIALQIELRPLLEQRADAIEVYRRPIRRLWDVVRATHNAYVGTKDDGLAGAIGADVSLRWTPGEMQPPVDDQVRIDNTLARLNARLISRLEAIAADRGITLEEAKKVAERIDAEAAERAAGTDELDASLLPLDPAKRAALKGAPADGAAPAPAPSSPAAAALDGVVQDTALNGAQVSSLLEIATAVVAGDLPITTAEAMIRAAFPALPAELVTRIIGGLKGFEPKADPAPPVSPPPPAPPPAG
jgi:hypothetical protein